MIASESADDAAATDRNLAAIAAALEKVDAANFSSLIAELIRHGFFARPESAALRSLFAAWSRCDAPSALTFARSLTEQNRDAALLAAMENARGVDDTTLLAYLPQLSPAAQRDFAVERLERRAAKRESVDSVFATVAQLSTTDAKAAAMEQVALTASPSALPNVIEWLEENHARALPAALQRWAGADPLAAASWVLIRPDSSAPEDLLSAAALGWTERSPADAADLLATFVDVPGWERALSTYSLALTHRYPAAATAWAALLRDPIARATVERQIAPEN